MPCKFSNNIIVVKIKIKHLKILFSGNHVKNIIKKAIENNPAFCPNAVVIRIEVWNVDVI